MPPDADIMVDGNDIWAPHPEASSGNSAASTVGDVRQVEPTVTDWVDYIFTNIHEK